MHALRQRNQQLVAHLVAVVVVDGFEGVQVNEHHRQQFPSMTLDLRHAGDQAVGQQNAVRQIGQTVKLGQVLQLVLVCLEPRDVGEQGHILFDIAPRIAHRDDGFHQGDEAAIFVPVPEFAGPVTLLRQGLKQGRVERLGLHTRIEKARIFAQHLIPGVAGDVGKGVVDVDDDAVGGGDHDAFSGNVEDAGSLNRFFGLDALRNVARRSEDALQIVVCIVKSSGVTRHHSFSPVFGAGGEFVIVEPFIFQHLRNGRVSPLWVCEVTRKRTADQLIPG